MESGAFIAMLRCNIENPGLARVAGIENVSDSDARSSKTSLIDITNYFLILDLEFGRSLQCTRPVVLGTNPNPLPNPA